MKDALFEGEISPKATKIAKAVSMAAQPPFISVVVFLILNTCAGDMVDYAVDSVACIMFALVLPMAIIYFFSVKYKNDDVDIVRREDRFWPLMIGSVSYLIGFGVLWFIGAPKVVYTLMLCYFVVTFAMNIATLFWKVSIHTCGIIGPTLGLIATFGPVGAVLFLLLPPVAWSRYVLRKHTPGQLVTGALIGFVLTVIIFYFML